MNPPGTRNLLQRPSPEDSPADLNLTRVQVPSPDPTEEEIARVAASIFSLNNPGLFLSEFGACWQKYGLKILQSTGLRDFFLGLIYGKNPWIQVELLLPDGYAGFLLPDGFAGLRDQGVSVDFNHIEQSIVEALFFLIHKHSDSSYLKSLAHEIIVVRNFQRDCLNARMLESLTEAVLTRSEDPEILGRVCLIAHHTVDYCFSNPIFFWSNMSVNERCIACLHRLFRKLQEIDSEKFYSLSHDLLSNAYLQFGLDRNDPELKTTMIAFLAMLIKKAEPAQMTRVIDRLLTMKPFLLREYLIASNSIPLLISKIDFTLLNLKNIPEIYAIYSSLPFQDGHVTLFLRSLAEINRRVLSENGSLPRNPSSILLELLKSCSEIFPHHWTQLEGPLVESMQWISNDFQKDAIFDFLFIFLKLAQAYPSLEFSPELRTQLMRIASKTSANFQKTVQLSFRTNLDPEFLRTCGNALIHQMQSVNNPNIFMAACMFYQGSALLNRHGIFYLQGFTTEQTLEHIESAIKIANSTNFDNSMSYKDLLESFTRYLEAVLRRIHLPDDQLKIVLEKILDTLFMKASVFSVLDFLKNIAQKRPLPEFKMVFFDMMGNRILTEIDETPEQQLPPNVIKIPLCEVFIFQALVNAKARLRLENILEAIDALTHREPEIHLHEETLKRLKSFLEFSRIL